ncbi:MAG TPA: squalene synthase HpnC, partial [Gammaproteobacteria bacterium]|nr:squalene synthase HpnC [Gammaproteobacteria bacterium]
DLMIHQWERAHALMKQGQDLGKRLSGLFGLDIRLIIAGGQCVLKKLKSRSDVYERPILQWYDWFRIACKGLYKI